ncbi:MAG: FRG domain-containing protein, partial [Proteobacteria bacterium]|nr:FRG domain-containing protein [Pseudomonadota bacterium]
GQRDAKWRVVPSFFRKSGEERAAVLARINSLATVIMARRPGLQAEQALALIQHYSNELAAPTWLIDLTWDPAVALFFASDGGRTGDLGVITMFVRREWEELAAGGRNRLGQIRLIEVPNVLRIERQRALFLDTSHPDLVEQYVAHSVWFYQVDNLVFEDQDADWPVSKEHCYPSRDPILESLSDVAVQCKEGAPEPVLAPLADATEPLGERDYLEIARSWCKEDGVKLESPHLHVLAGVCHVYSLLQQHRDQLKIELRSLHRLREATNAIVLAQEAGRRVDVSEAMEFTLGRSMTDAEREVLDQLVNNVRPAGLGGPVADLPSFIKGLLIELPTRLAELVVIGADDAREGRVQHDIEAVLGDSSFRVFDLRGATDLNGVAALATDVADVVRLLLVDDATAQGWLHGLARAVLDEKECIEFKEGWVERQKGRSIVVVHYGAKEIQDFAPILRELIVQFII